MAGRTRLLFVGVALAAALLSGCGGENGADSKSSTAAKSKNTESAPAAPQQLLIPDLKVKAKVVGVATSDGVLLPPRKPKVVGWWSGSAKPGEDRGSVVIAGHTVHTGGGALDELPNLRPDATIEVVTGGGERVKYSVDAVVDYEKGEVTDQAAQIFDQEVDGRLVVVTCDEWDGKEYQSNVVVYASPKSAA